MKVRAKTPCIGHNYEVVEETTRFYITLEDGLSHYLALPKDDYEPVEEWVDVTAECDVMYYCGCRGAITHKGRVLYSDDPLYRLKATGSHGIRVERKQV